MRGEVLSITQRDHVHAAAALKPGPMQDLRVRRAMNHAVDVDFAEAGIDPAKLVLTLDTPSGRYPLDKDVSLAIAAQLQRWGIKTNVVVNERGTHLDKIKNRNTGDLFFLGWNPSIFGQTVMEPLFQARQTCSSYGNNKAIDDKIAHTVTVVDPKGRATGMYEAKIVPR